jgi:hypothetical protein
MSEGPWVDDNAREIFTYEVLLQRELEQDAMLWQTPTIALTAQAFLLTIALNADSGAFATYLSASLGILVATMSMQLMGKHRVLSEMDRSHLHYLEDRLGIEHLSNRSYFYIRGKYSVPDWLASHRPPPTPSFLAKQKSFKVWMRGMVVFVLVNAAIIAVQALAPDLLRPAG